MERRISLVYGEKLDAMKIDTAFLIFSYTKNLKGGTKMQNGKWLKVAGMVTTVLGFALTIAEGFINDKQMDIQIAEKVAEALSNVGKK